MLSIRKLTRAFQPTVLYLPSSVLFPSQSECLLLVHKKAWISLPVQMGGEGTTWQQASPSAPRVHPHGFVVAWFVPEGFLVLLLSPSLYFFRVRTSSDCSWICLPAPHRATRVPQWPPPCRLFWTRRSRVSKTLSWTPGKSSSSTCYISAIPSQWVFFGNFLSVFQSLLLK